MSVVIGLPALKKEICMNQLLYFLTALSLYTISWTKELHTITKKKNCPETLLFLSQPSTITPTDLELPLISQEQPCALIAPSCPKEENEKPEDEDTQEEDEDQDEEVMVTEEEEEKEEDEPQEEDDEDEE